MQPVTTFSSTWPQFSVWLWTENCLINIHRYHNVYHTNMIYNEIHFKGLQHFLVCLKLISNFYNECLIVLHVCTNICKHNVCQINTNKQEKKILIDLRLIYVRVGYITLWSYQMKAFFAWLALREGNLPVTGSRFPSQRPVTQSFDISFGMRLSCCRKNFQMHFREWQFLLRGPTSIW